MPFPCGSSSRRSRTVADWGNLQRRECRTPETAEYVPIRVDLSIDPPREVGRALSAGVPGGSPQEAPLSPQAPGAEHPNHIPWSESR